MKKWPLIMGGSAVLAGGVLFAMQGSNSSADETVQAAGAPKDAASSEAALAERRKITDDPVAPKFEPADYDVTIVTYSDYQCPFCRKVHPVLERIAREDGKVRIVYRDWPIFGPASEEAASAAIASQWQGKHAAFNDALMRTEGKLDSVKIRAAANAVGVDWARLQRDVRGRKSEIDALIGRTSRQAAEMRLQGTPALLIGPYLVPGAIDYAGLSKAVSAAREFEQQHAR